MALTAVDVLHEKEGRKKPYMMKTAQMLFKIF